MEGARGGLGGEPDGAGSCGSLQALRPLPYEMRAGGGPCTGEGLSKISLGTCLQGARMEAGSPVRRPLQWFR